MDKYDLLTLDQDKTSINLPLQETLYSDGTLKESYTAFKEKVELYKIVKNGSYISYYQNRQIKITCNYSNGYLHGPYNEYYIEGTPRISTAFENGLKTGPYKEYYEDGTLKLETSYANDLEHGIRKEYMRISGKHFCSEESEFENGFKKSYRCFDDKGRVDVEGTTTHNSTITKYYNNSSKYGRYLEHESIYHADTNKCIDKYYHDFGHLGYEIHKVNGQKTYQYGSSDYYYDY